MSDRIRERLEGILAEFRADEPAAPDWVTAPDALSFLLAWKKLPAQIGEPLFLGQPPIHRHNRWAYAWKYRRVDHDALAKMAGLTDGACRDLFVKLVAAHLIYPDGSLARQAADILAAANN